MSERVEQEASPSLGPLYAQALAGAAVPFGRSGELPDKVLVRRDVEIDRERLADYDRVCGFGLGDRLPPTYLHVPAFPLAMALMADRSFPFPLLGLVHVANAIEQRRPLDAGERPTLRVWAEDLRAHPRGRQFDMVAEAEVDGETVWTDRSTYLRRGGGEPDAEPEPGMPDEAAPRRASATWKVPGDIGRRYAGVSGDRNPIHLHSLSARLFGFPGAIAHGMWSLARCLAALESRLPDAHRSEVRFRAPLRIPGTARFAAEADGAGWAFALLPRDEDGRPHLVGSVAPLG